MTKLVVSVTCVSCHGVHQKKIPKLCTSRLAMRWKSCCQAEQAVFSWSVAFSVVVVRTVLIVIPFTRFMYSNLLQEEGCLNDVVLTAPELSQVLFLSVKSRSHSVPPRLLNRIFRGKSWPFWGGSCYQNLVTQLVGRWLKPQKVKSPDFPWINSPSKAWDRNLGFSGVKSHLKIFLVLTF